jgi:subtilisin family serine protease
LTPEYAEVGAYDRYRVLDPDWPGAVASSRVASVTLSRPSGVRWSIEEFPSVDSYQAYEALDALAVAPWHEAGISGAGVKVAVFDVQWLNADLYADELGTYTTHDCENQRSCDATMDTLRPRYAFEEGSHGVACATVIRDIAPGVELHLVRVNGATTFESAVDWAIREGIDVVSMSMSFFNNSFHDGTGSVADAVGDLRAAGTLLVNSAGNYATEHRDGNWRDDDHDQVAEFPWGSEYLPVKFGKGASTVTVAWDQFSRCGDTDLDAYVYASDGTVLGKGEDDQEPEAEGCSPVERVTFDAPEKDWYYLQLRRRRGDESVRFAVFARNGEIYQPTAGSMADPASSVSAFTVGAVRAGGYGTNGVESFSSTGPTHGGLAKPDLAGPDGLTTPVYGPNGFYGTSAAAPAVTAAIALLMEEDPRLDAFGAAERLQAEALSDHATWEDWDGELGAGRARLPAPGDAGGCGGDGGAAGLVVLARWRLRRPRRRAATPSASGGLELPRRERMHDR